MYMWGVCVYVVCMVECMCVHMVCMDECMGVYIVCMVECDVHNVIPYYVKTYDNTNVHVFTVCVHVKSTNCSLEWLNSVIVFVCVCYNY